MQDTPWTYDKTTSYSNVIYDLGTQGGCKQSYWQVTSPDNDTLAIDLLGDNKQEFEAQWEYQNLL